MMRKWNQHSKTRHSVLKLKYDNGKKPNTYNPLYTVESSAWFSPDFLRWNFGGIFSRSLASLSRLIKKFKSIAKQSYNKLPLLTPVPLVWQMLICQFKLFFIGQTIWDKFLKPHLRLTVQYYSYAHQNHPTHCSYYSAYHHHYAE